MKPNLDQNIMLKQKDRVMNKMFAIVLMSICLSFPTQASHETDDSDDDGRTKVVKKPIRTPIITYDCDGCNMGDALITNYVKRLPHDLGILKLSKNIMSDTGLKSLTIRMKWLQELEQLDISHNNVTYKGVLDLIQNLPPRLSSLNLNGIELGKAIVLQLELLTFHQAPVTNIWVRQIPKE